VEQEQPIQEGDGARGDREPPLADVPLDVKADATIEQPVEPAEAVDGDDFVPVDLGKEESDTAAETEREEIVDVPLATPEIIEEVISTDAETHVHFDPVEQTRTEEPAPDVEEKANDNEAKPELVELPPATPEGAEGEGGAVEEAGTPATVVQVAQPAEEEKKDGPA
jgi:hypothetical protein